MEESTYIELTEDLQKEHGEDHLIYVSGSMKRIYILKNFKYVVFISLSKKNSRVTFFSLRDIIGGILDEVGKKIISVKLSEVEKNVKKILRHHGFKTADLYLSKEGG